MRGRSAFSTVRGMAVTERIEMNPNVTDNSPRGLDGETFLPGLRVMARMTSSSMSDYPEWDLKDHTNHPVVTDGACS